MLKTRLVGNHGCNVNVKPERPIHTMPKIAEVYFDADGIRMYETTDNRHFIADVVDRIFKPIKTAVRKKGYKGPNPDGSRIQFS